MAYRYACDILSLSARKTIKMTKTHTVYEVLYLDEKHPYSGNMGDGSFIARFKKKANAEKFAKGKESYSGPSSVEERTGVSKRLMDRWSSEGAFWG